MHLAILEHQIISKSLAIQDRQITSGDLAIQEVQDDVCPRHLGMLVTSCCHHQAKGEGIHVEYSTPPTESLLKTKYTVKTWH